MPVPARNGGYEDRGRWSGRAKGGGIKPADELTLSVGLGTLLDEMHRVLGELLQRSNQKLVDV